MPFKRVDDGALTTIRAEGTTTIEIFIDAAHGLFDVLCSGCKVRGDDRQEIVLQAEDEKSLFREWLKELLARVIQTGMIYSDFEVFSIQKAGAKQYVLTGAVYGEAIDPSRHTIAPDISLDEQSATCTLAEKKSSCSFQIRRT